jgi:hypothetical protein
MSKRKNANFDQYISQCIKKIKSTNKIETNMNVFENIKKNIKKNSSEGYLQCFKTLSNLTNNLNEMNNDFQKNNDIEPVKIKESNLNITVLHLMDIKKNLLLNNLIITNNLKR